MGPGRGCPVRLYPRDQKMLQVCGKLGSRQIHVNGRGICHRSKCGLRWLRILWVLLFPALCRHHPGLFDDSLWVGNLMSRHRLFYPPWDGLSRRLMNGGLPDYPGRRCPPLRVRGGRRGGRRANLLDRRCRWSRRRRGSWLNQLIFRNQGDRRRRLITKRYWLSMHDHKDHNDDMKEKRKDKEPADPPLSGGTDSRANHVILFRVFGRRGGNHTEPIDTGKLDDIHQMDDSPVVDLFVRLQIDNDPFVFLIAAGE